MLLDSANAIVVRTFWSEDVLVSEPFGQEYYVYRYFAYGSFQSWNISVMKHKIFQSQNISIMEYLYESQIIKVKELFSLITFWA